MEKILAKSNGLSLEAHSKIIEEVSVRLIEKIINNETVKVEYSETIRLSSLLHDIGKATKNFQEFLNGNRNKPNLTFRHNEIGWAFLSKYLSDEFKNKDLILNIVHWHHGISNIVGKHTDTEILNSICDESIENMLQYLVNIVGEEFINEDVEFSDSNNAPLFYPTLNKNKLPDLQLCRSIVITSDRIGSEFTSIEEINEDLIDSYFNITSDIELGVTKFDGSIRYENQKNIVKETEGTSIVKAPAGFGKTLIGILWGLKNNKKTIWVVPRNTIGESLYASITDECNNLNISPSIQLILTNEVKKTNNDDLGLFEADIIITNIDNFLAPSFKNDIMDSSSLLLGANVIFDEYHELISNAPLMGLFINIMRVRHRLNRVDTLLLSATPIECEWLWDSIGYKTQILPNKENHYPPIHNKPYKLIVTNKKPSVLPNSNTLVIKNTIKSAQHEKLDNEYFLLLHSDFIDEKKENDFIKLLTNYGKYSVIDNNKPNVIGTHIIQASLDISFNHLIENVLSPQSTIQRIGRCDRFGDSVGQTSITILKELGSNENYVKSENKIKDILYSRNLSDCWFEYIQKHTNKDLTLSDFYSIFNEFNKENSKAIKNFVRTKYDESLNHLVNIYPIKYDKKMKSNVLTAGSNKLRSVNNEIFFIVKHQDSEDRWVGPFTKEVFSDFDRMFREDSNVLKRMKKTMNILRNENDMRFEFNDIIDNKYITIDGVRRLSKKSNTPYIVYDREYHDELGIVKLVN
jgi:CRISPR-associated endonuclease Cas3-HD